MCNAWNHSPACTCGFGGECHWGRGGGRPPVPVLRHLGSAKFETSSMVDLARSLGHSLVFPVICKYCGAPIYLFASSHGGFAVFDELGPPWPKHRCMGITNARSIDCRFAESRIARYELPVPSIALLVRKETGAELRGVVVSSSESDKSQGPKQFYEIDVYDGRLYRELLVDRQLQLGACISGTIVMVPALGFVLQNLKVYPPPDESGND